MHVFDLDAASMLVDHGYCHSISDDIQVRIGARNYSPGFIVEGRKGRQVQGGDLVPGPWGWLNECATVISRMPSRTVRLAAEYGDEIVADGVTYVIKRGVSFGRKFPTLEVKGGE